MKSFLRWCVGTFTIAQLSFAHAIEHVYCKNDAGSLQAKMVFYVDLDQGSGFVMLANHGRFVSSSDPDARVFNVTSKLPTEIKVLVSQVHPETLVISSDLEKIMVFEASGQLRDVLTCSL